MHQFTVRRIQNYLFANGIDVYNQIPSDLFRFNEVSQEFDLWSFEIAEPVMTQLVIDYPDSVIAKEIALKQLRVYRNIMLLDTDKFITADFPLTQQVKDEILAWRQALRELPESISESLLVLNQHGRLNLNGIFPSPPVTGALLKLKSKFSFL